MIASFHLSPPLAGLPWKLVCPDDTGGTPAPLPLAAAVAASGRSGVTQLERLEGGAGAELQPDLKTCVVSCAEDSAGESRQVCSCHS